MATDLPSLTDVELIRRMESLIDWLIGEGATVNAAEVREACSRLTARAPVTPTPEPATVGPNDPRWEGLAKAAMAGPATVERCGAVMFNDDPSHHACTRLAGHKSKHANDFGEEWETPAPEPARPPAVTRTIRERWDDLYRAGGYTDRSNPFFALSCLVDVLDEDEARRDADRRETK